ncbi:MAG: hypothetical protein P8X70_02660 [Nanoarchaeota archaeon]|jgi:hypothetical protein
MGKKVKKEGFLKAFFSFIGISIAIGGITSYFVFNERLIGFVFLTLGAINLLFLKLFKIELKAVYPDIIFGMIDNGVLVFAAVLGGHFAGVFGAIIGGAAGNTITDGIGGLFEGYIAEHQREVKIDNLRTAMSTMLGKMTGCLLGAGIGLIIIFLIGI